MITSVSELNALANHGLGAILGLTITTVDAATKSVTATWDLNANVLDYQGKVHDGAISSVVETVASVAAQAALEQPGTVVGVSNSTNFIRPTDQSPLTVVGTAVARSGTQQLWTVTVATTDGELVAQGNVRLQQLTT